MLFDWRALSLLFGVTALFNAWYMLQVFGESHRVYARRLAVIGSVNLFCTLFAVLLSPVNRLLEVLQKPAIFLQKILDVHHPLSTAASSIGMLLFFSLLMLLFLPWFLRQRSAKMLAQGNISGKAVVGLLHHLCSPSLRFLWKGNREILHCYSI